MEKTQKIGLIMNVLMGLSLSFALSLLGLLSSGHFEKRAWLLSFVLSALLSLLIGFFVPVRKIAFFFKEKLDLSEKSLAFHCLDSLVSDFCYTPLITLLMVSLAYVGAKRQISEAILHGASETALDSLRFFPMFFHALLISMIAGYALIFVLQPLFLKILLPKQKSEH